MQETTEKWLAELAHQLLMKAKDYDKALSAFFDKVNAMYTDADAHRCRWPDGRMESIAERASRIFCDARHDPGVAARLKSGALYDSFEYEPTREEIDEFYKHRARTHKRRADSLATEVAAEIKRIEKA